jgi:hypothetical protein
MLNGAGCENLIKAHLASDRTSCTRATANQFRLLIHSAAYWLLLSLRALAPRNKPLGATSNPDHPRPRRHKKLRPQAAVMPQTRAPQ